MRYVRELSIDYCAYFIATGKSHQKSYEFHHAEFSIVFDVLHALIRGYYL